MNTIILLAVGIAASRLGRRFMKNRYYSSFDDLLLGILGALLGDSLADLFAFSVFGFEANLLTAFSCASLVLVLTGAYIETQGEIQLRRRFYMRHRPSVPHCSPVRLNAHSSTRQLEYSQTAQ